MSTEFGDTTTVAMVEAYEASCPVFLGIIKEIRELSRKKPEATMSVSKVRIVNRVLADLLVFLKNEPSGKYLDLLDDESLPQLSDAVLTMVQFEAALTAFKDKYYRYVRGDMEWLTEEAVLSWENDEEDSEDDDSEEL